MRAVSLKIPEIGFIAGTRAALGAGVALMLADRLNRRQQKTVGRVLMTIGAVTTVPLAIKLMRKAKTSLKSAA